MTTPAQVDPVEWLAAGCRRSFTAFAKTFWEQVPGAGVCVWNWHMTLLCEEMEVAARRVFKGLPKPYDLIFNQVFGTSKSTLLSILFPAWTWTVFPQCRHITATHSEALARELAGKGMRVVQSPLYRRLFPHVVLDKKAEEYYTNTLGGDRRICTVGGKTPMGTHAHCVEVDDPLDPQAARSEAELETAAKFMTEVIPTRVVDKAVALVTLVMQRLHHRDPTAVLLEVAKKDGAVPVRHVVLPGEIDPGEVTNPPLEELRRRFPESNVYADGLMDPVRMPRTVLANFRARLGEVGYFAQVKQNPTPPGGAMFKAHWFSQTVRAAPRDAVRVRGYDRAATAGGGCATAGVRMSRDSQGRYYVEHCVWGQWEPNERNDTIVATARQDRSRYGPKTQNVPVVLIEAERGSTGLESFQGIARRLAGFRVKEIRPTGSKDTRAEPWADQLAAMNVWFVSDGTWDLAGFIEEHLLFRQEGELKRTGGFKDRVDSAAMCFSYLAGAPQVSLGKVLGFRTGGKDKKVKLVVCKGDELKDLDIDQKKHRCLLLKVLDPVRSGEGVMPDGTVLSVPELSRNERAVSAADMTEAGVSEETPAYPFVCVAETALSFADLDPKDLQQEWQAPVPGYGRPPEELIMTPEQGKKVWAFLLKKRDPGADVIVLHSPGGRRALSLAYSLCDHFRTPRTEVFLPGVGVAEGDTGKAGGDGEPPAPPNDHCFQTLKRTRHAVVG